MCAAAARGALGIQCERDVSCRCGGVLRVLCVCVCVCVCAAVSSITDQSFDLCQFRDDLQPLGARIHSSQLKILTSN